MSSEALGVAFLTSHNVLFLATIDHPLSSDAGYTLSAHRLAAGPATVLYSAHLRILQNGRFLVAVGTVFGDVYIWAYQPDFKTAKPEASMTGRLLYSFSGHEGSVFGVRILNDSHWGTNRPVVASCSDDRTIRIWDISGIATMDSSHVERDSVDSIEETGFVAADRENAIGKNMCIASVMGHASRIWALRFLPDLLGTRRLLSFGEDATSQLWRIKASTDFKNTASGPSPLLHEAKFTFHNGKSIWSAAVQPKDDNGFEVLTGGADGGISLFKIGSGDFEKHLECEFGVVLLSQAVADNDPVEDKASKVLLPGQSIFDALQGSWELHRVLSSAIPTFPSGIFRGIAKLSPRSATDPQFDGEYLYIEEGTLVTEQGLSLRGSRRYVYRYQRSTDLVTAWFVKPDGEAVDYFFHTVQFQEISGLRRSENLQAKDTHLCVEDLYEVEYQFRPRNKTLSTWSVQYQVTGPKKDYFTATEYRKIPADTEKSEAVPNPGAEKSEDERFSQQKDPNDTKSTGKSDPFKSYGWIGDHEILATTAEGRIMLGSVKEYMNKDRALPRELTLHDILWMEISQLSDLKSYSVITSIRHTKFALLSGASGMIHLFENDSKSVASIAKLSTKLSSLFAQVLISPENAGNLGIIGTCLGSNKASMFKVSMDLPLNENGSSSFIDFGLPKNLTVTAAHWCDADDLVILGSRDGALCFYRLSRSNPSTDDTTLTHCLETIHGKDAITSITPLPRQHRTALYILTTGRNGKFAIHNIDIPEPHTIRSIGFSTVHVSEPPFGPNIEGAFFDASIKELILWGFRGKQFVVWNDTKQKETMVVECGGSHRSWAYCPNYGNDGGQFVWTKASSGHAHLHAQGYHRVIQSGGHGREIKAVATRPEQSQGQSQNTTLVATGAEDTTIRIFSYHTHDNISQQAWKCRAIIKTHTTGLQKLQWSPDGNFLFSAGGCEELFAWRIRSIPYLGVGTVQAAQCPKLTKSSDLRVMDFHISPIQEQKPVFLVSAIYSDSTIRLWSFTTTYHATKSNFTLLSTTTYSKNCLTLINSTPLQRHHFGPLILTASTDGHIAAWAHLPDNSLSLQARHRIHQSSIKSLAVLRLPESSGGSLVLATAGDDGAVGFIRMSHGNRPPSHGFGGSEHDLTFSTLLLPKAHASTITAILDITPPPHPSPPGPSESSGMREFTLATTGPDQLLKTWHLAVDASKPGVEGFRVRKGGSVHSEVADASCLDLMILPPGIMGGADEDGNEEGKGKNREGKGSDGELERRDLRGVLIVGVGMEVLRM
ncbi:MAG: hypothetical protein MMC33_009009 [Icmadophila ericetorum]|nr:hypothetical protein [Icmadophila ericetorum]